MTDEAEITGGYLKKWNNFAKAAIWWNDLSDNEKNIIKAIPNFNKAIFEEITGIDVDDKKYNGLHWGEFIYDRDR